MAKWKGNPEKKAQCYNNFLTADWKTILKDKSEKEIEEELERMAEGEDDSRE